MTLIEYTDREMMAIDLAYLLAEELETCLLHHDFASFAVPGGSTPGPIFDALCAADLDWSRVYLMPTDERWVPDGHVRSNVRLINERLRVNRAADAHLVSFHGNGALTPAHIDKLNDAIIDNMPLSVLLLGMGTDMHCASLFPGSPELEAALAVDAPAVLAQTPPTQEEHRITLSAPILNGALSKHIVMTGDDKRTALERAVTLPPEEAPINAVLNGASVHWTA